MAAVGSRTGTQQGRDTRQTNGEGGGKPGCLLTCAAGGDTGRHSQSARYSHRGAVRSVTGASAAFALSRTALAPAGSLRAHHRPLD